MKRGMLKKLSALIVSAILFAHTLCTPVPLFADLSSLTNKELADYKRATEQARYYKYYEALLKGEDRAIIFQSEQIGEEGDFWIYEITLILRVADQDFHRKFKQKVEKTGNKDSRFMTILKESGKYAVGIIVGILIGAIAL